MDNHEPRAGAAIVTGAAAISAAGPRASSPPAATGPRRRHRRGAGERDRGRDHAGRRDRGRPRRGRQRRRRGAGYVAACVERYGAPDAFFNNAGVEARSAISRATRSRLSTARSRSTCAGPSSACATSWRRCARAPAAARSSTTASQAGVRGVPNLAGYVASKHGVVGLSQSVAIECAPDIRVNCLCPGPVATRMMRDIEDEVRRHGGDPASFVARIPAGRYGEPEEIGRFAAWVLADAPEFLTGAVLTVDGAMTAL